MVYSLTDIYSLTNINTILPFSSKIVEENVISEQPESVSEDSKLAPGPEDSVREAGGWVELGSLGLDPGHVLALLRHALALCLLVASAAILAQALS